MPEYIMLQGTSSHVGKSVLATALCRIFLQEGRSVSPFKAQNMALNSYVTHDGREMGRAQVAQAEAAGIIPESDMNPVLLKPTGNCHSQVIINGHAVGNMSAKEYHRAFSLKAFSAVKEALERLKKRYDILVIEGAGSPAEVNLKDHDIVNMRVAKYLNAPVLLIADVDRGGSLAALVGTLMLLDEDERNLVQGLIINKFRGDPRLYDSAVSFLEERTGKPVLGVIPYIEDLGIDDEDSVSLDSKHRKSGDIDIAVVRLPKISNFTDFDSLAGEGDVSVRYVSETSKLGCPDVVILPGSKNTIADMNWLRYSRMESAIRELVEQQVPVVGICGGYQMLGERINDPYRTESAMLSIDGLSLLPIRTDFLSKKQLSQVKGTCCRLPFAGQIISSDELKGYEIHMGQTTDCRENLSHPFLLTERSGIPCHDVHGTARQDGLVWGTYMHGIFDNDVFRRSFINALREKKGLAPIKDVKNFRAEKQKHYNRLAEIVQTHLNVNLLHKIMSGRQYHDGDSSRYY